MPSTYSTSLGLELIGNGEQAGTWGTTTNNNLGTLLEQAIAGVESITLVGGDYTLTDYNGLPDQARNAVLVFGGLLGAPCNVIAPAVEKTYIVRNFSNATVTIKTAGGNGIAIANAASEVIFCNGSDFFSATQFNYIDGNLTVTGSVSIGANQTTAGNAVFLKNVYGNASTDQWYLPTGNTVSRTSSPIDGLIRYNSEGKFYEGYANSTWVRFLVVNQGVYTITYVAVGGGGGAKDIGSSGTFNSGGAGGGKVTASTTSAIPGTTILTITVGGGGAAGSQGSSSLITGIVDAIGGFANPQSASNSAGGTSGNGFTGGAGVGDGGGGSGQGGGGGAGASSNGGPAATGGEGLFFGGSGGTGAETLITGTSQYFGGGGGGGAYSSGGSGGSGGGGRGNGGASATNGTVNTGGGGGHIGISYSGGITGGTGGSGVVIIRYAYP
jgi:hypothetical protein